MEKVINKIIEISAWFESHEISAFLEGIIAFMLIAATITCFVVGEAPMGVFCLLNFILVSIPAIARCLKTLLK